jgi:hypothetical protein
MIFSSFLDAYIASKNVFSNTFNACIKVCLSVYVTDMQGHTKLFRGILENSEQKWRTNLAAMPGKQDDEHSWPVC